MRSSTITEQSVAHKGPVVRIPQNGRTEEVNSTVQQSSASPLSEPGLTTVGRAVLGLIYPLRSHGTILAFHIGVRREKDLSCWVSACAWIVVDVCATPSFVPIAVRLLVAGIAT